MTLQSHEEHSAGEEVSVPMLAVTFDEQDLLTVHHDSAAASASNSDQERTKPSSASNHAGTKNTEAMDEDTDMASDSDGADAEEPSQSVPKPLGGRSVPGIRVYEAEEEQHGREPTPEMLANLGQAVDMVQARSCQLSPSLLTVGQTPPDMDSPARDAFERGMRANTS